MLYDTLMRKAVDATIVKENGSIYLKPEYRNILRKEGLTAEKVTDTSVSNEEIWDYLKLEVERLKEMWTKREYVYEWLYSIFNETMNPMLTEADNELMKDLIEYAKLKNTVEEKAEMLDTKEKELQNKEEFIDKKQDIGIAGFNFSKRTKI